RAHPLRRDVRGRSAGRAVLAVLRPDTQTMGPPAHGGAEGELFAVGARGRPVFPEQFVMSLHGLLCPPARRFGQRRPRLSLELLARARQICFVIWMPTHERPFV